MRDTLKLYRKLVILCGAVVVFAIVTPAPRGASATTMPTPVKTTAADTRQRLTTGECRVDMQAYVPMCVTRRMIKE